MILLWLACAAPSSDTLIDELRILAILTDVPEAVPGQTVASETVVFDPFEDHQLLQWTCSSFAPGTCLEADSESWEGISLNEYYTEFMVPPELVLVADESPKPFLSRWALACEPNACPFLDDFSEPLSDDLRDRLQDPMELLRDLPLEGVSLAVRSIDISTRSNPRINPELVCEGPDQAAPAETVEYACEVSGEFDTGASIWGYTSGGAWIGDYVSLSTGDTEVLYSMLAPEEQGEIQLWLVIIDGAAGTSIWSGSLNVQ